MDFVRTIEFLSKEYPVRFAPWIGMLAGAGFAAFMAVRTGKFEDIWFNIAACAGAGLGGGVVIYILRHPANKAAGPTKLSPGKILLAFVGLLLAWIPVFGLIFALVGWASNMHCKSWARTLSYVALGISILAMAVLMAYLIIVAEK